MSAAMKSSTSVRAATLAAAETADDAVEPMIVKFLDAVWMERGLSPNTLAAYRADLTALRAGCASAARRSRARRA